MYKVKNKKKKELLKREKAIGLLAFYFISKDVQEEMDDKGYLSVETALRDESLRLMIRTLQRLELNLGDYKEAEFFCNLKINEFNKKGKFKNIEYFPFMVGYAVLTLYKEHWKTKRIYKGLKYGELNSWYEDWEKKIVSLYPKKGMTMINNSFNMAEDMFKRVSGLVIQ